MAFFIGIACPWLLVILIDRIATARRRDEFEALGLQPPPATNSSYLVPDRPY